MTFTDGQLTVIPNFFAVLPAIPLAVWILRRGAGRRRTLLALLALGHVTAVVALTIFPIPIAGQEFYRQTRGMSEDNVVPFATIAWQLQNLTLNTVRQLLGNVVALTPLGIYGPGLWPALRDWRRFLIVAVAFGVGIEICQYAGSLLEGFTYRVTDVDDAIMNAVGAVAAFLAWREIERRGWVEQWVERWLRPVSEPAMPEAAEVAAAAEAAADQRIGRVSP
jgi:glycopeptide antibiotics resistance protein